MKEGFNFLEQAVLEWYKNHYNDPILSSQIDSARLIKRDWTKVGFYVYFEIKKDLPPVNLDWPIDGPSIQSDEIEYGGGAMLWGENGRINCIEMYACGDYFGEDVKDFSLFGPDEI